MDDQLKLALELCHEPMLALENGIVLHLNAAAHAEFPELTAGRSAAPYLPEHILFSEAGQAAATAVIKGRSYTATMSRAGTLLLLSLLPTAQSDAGLLSDGVLVGMRSALFNIGLSAQRLSSQQQLMPEAARHLMLLRHNYHLLLRQLGNLSTALALEEKTAFLRISHIDLVEFCRDLAVSVSGLETGTLAGLEFTTPLTSLCAGVDAEKLTRLLLNLLANSFQSCGSGGIVRLRLTRQGENAVISVDDDGDGIPPEILQNVFSRYNTRLTPESLSRRVSGGLGLSVAKGIAELHGGALVIESRPGIGTSVRVMLPLEQTKSDVLEDQQTFRLYDLEMLLTELADVLPASCYECEASSD